MIIKTEERLYLTSEELRTIDEAWRICSNICETIDDEETTLLEYASKALQGLEWLFTEAKEEGNEKVDDKYEDEWKEDEEEEWEEVDDLEEED